MEELGLRLNAKKSVLFPLQRTTYLGVVWDSTTMQAHMSPARIESILTAVVRVREHRSLTVKQFQKLVGLKAAVSNVIPFDLLYMRPPTVVAQDQGVFPEGKSASHDQGHAALLSCLRRVEKTLVLVTGPSAGSSLSLRNAYDGRVPHRLGSGHEWPPCPLSVERSPSHVAHQLLGDAGRVSRQPGMGMETPRRCGGSDLESVWLGSGGSDCDSGDIALRSSSQTGCHGTDLAEASSVLLSPDCSALRSSGESAPGQGPSTASSPVLAGPSMILGPDFPSRRLSMGDSYQEGSPLTGGGHHLSPPLGAVEAGGVAPEGAQLVASSLSSEVVETILQSRASSTRKRYALKWKLFTSWCRDHQLDPVNGPIGSVWTRFSTGWPTPPWRCTWWPQLLTTPFLVVSPWEDTPWWYVSSVVHWGWGPRYDLGFPCGTWPWSWSLSADLHSNHSRRFQMEIWHLRLSFLLAISSLKRVGDLQAPSVAHMTHMSTALPCGGSLTNFSYTMVFPREVCLPPSRRSVGGSLMPFPSHMSHMSPLVSPRHWGSRLTPS